MSNETIAMPEMPNISMGELPDFVSFVVTELKEPLMIWGGFGIGKTRVMEQAAEEAGAFLVPILLSQYESVDIRGLPSPDLKTDSTRWLKASTFPFKGNKGFPTDRPIWVFLDEMTSSTQPVMAVGYQLVNDLRVGEFELMDNVRIIAAGNREQDKGIVNRMPMPLNNRFVHCEAIVDVDAFTEWGTSVGLPAVGMAFIQWRKQLLHNYDPKKSGKVVATPRSWEKAFRAYGNEKASDIHKEWAMAGAVGSGPTAEFMGFVKIWQRVRGMLKDIMQNPESAPLLEDQSEMYAVAVSLSGEMSKKTADAIYKYLTRMEPMYTVLAMTLACRRDREISETDAFMNFATKYKAVFQK